MSPANEKAGDELADVKAKTTPLEEQWARDAEAKGLKGAAKLLADFRSEIAKASK